MEDADELPVVTKDEPHIGDPVASLNTAHSNAKLLTDELPPDSPSEKENSANKPERLDSFVASNKVNGDCVLECAVSSPPILPTTTNNASLSCKISSEKDVSYNEKQNLEDADENLRCDFLMKEITPEESFTNASNLKAKNINPTVQLHNDQLLKLSDDRTLDRELTQSECIENPNLDMVTSNLEEKSSSEISINLPIKHENKTITKTKRQTSDFSVSGSSKNNENFKTPSRYELKSKAKFSDCENNQKQNDTNKTTDKGGRSNKKKNDEKHLNSNEVDFNELEKFPIQYKGFKTKLSNNYEKQSLNLRWNPFNPACKPNRKFNKCVPSRFPVGDELDCSSLQQSEYAQYLGLQPILKFRCSNCGSSAFQSMVALNTHQIECTKSGKGRMEKIPNFATSNSIAEPKSTNIKLTRKVFLCSACGTYYEHWDLFLHMREVHRRYICLYCLGMFSIAEKLTEHLTQKHKITQQSFCSLENFQKCNYQAFFMLCPKCDKVYSEIDEFYFHACALNKKRNDSIETPNKSEISTGHDSNVISNEVTNGCSNKSISKRVKDTNKKVAPATKSVQPKKDETLTGVPPKKVEDLGLTDSKDAKYNEVTTNSSSETGISGSLSEKAHSESNTVIQGEIESSDHDTKLLESQICTENLPSQEKTKQLKKTRPVSKKSAAKRKKPKDDECETSTKLKKTLEDPPVLPEPPNLDPPVPPEPPNLDPPEPPNLDTPLPPEPQSIRDLVSTEENNADGKDELLNAPQDPIPDDVQETNAHLERESTQKIENIDEEKTSLEIKEEELSEASKNDVSPTVSNSAVETKTKLQTNLLKFKLPGIESDGESDDSQKLSVVVDENANSDAEHKNLPKDGGNAQVECETGTGHDTTEPEPSKIVEKKSRVLSCEGGPDITLASEEVAVMALTLDDKIENIPIQTVLKECVRTSCMSCNYCRHAVKIAVNGKQLAIHILSEHRFMPVKNETPDDVINKLNSSLTSLQSMFFNTETYDSSDHSIHVPYDQDSSFDCFQCNYVTSSHRDLFAHKRKSHTKSLLLCIMCKSNFYSYSELLCHLCPGTYNAEIQFHNVDINFRCCFCRLDTIPSAFRLMVHLRKTHHTCDICLENGVDQQKLSTHMWKHKLNHLCYRCGIAYASKPDITKHLFWKHGHESVLCKKCLQKKWPHVYHFCIPPTSFICEECNTSFSKAVALKVHKRIHGNDFPYMCSECNKKFVSKKLLQRHQERHDAIKNNDQNNPESNQEEEQKEEIINVADVTNENKDTSLNSVSESKEIEPKDKSHKKHKRDKDKKDKQVVDVYDLPPLNLSSDSDSSDEDNTLNDNCVSRTNVPPEEDKSVISTKNKESENQDLSAENEDDIPSDQMNINVNMDSKISSPDVPNSFDNANKETSPMEEAEDKLDEADKTDITCSIQPDNVDIMNTSKVSESEQEGDKSEPENLASHENLVSNKEVEDIWKNFYNTNPKNSNFPYPLCAIKSEIAFDIVMGDHDYCQQPPEILTFPEEIPSTSGLSGPLINDNLEEVIDMIQEKVSDLSVSKVSTCSSPLNSLKKKPKSPKKKSSRGENENNSSSSSDSSSESSSSSCSCGPNCSCSSSSSNSSSSSSSESESSAGEEGTKQERKRKKRDRRSKGKSDHETELVKEQAQPQSEIKMSMEPVDPPIRESELETDETTTDEEFYDQQPQRIANQLLAEKRNQLMLLASAANANNGSSSPSPLVDVLQPEVVSPSKLKIKNKRKRKVTSKGKTGSDKSLSNSHPFSQYKDNEQCVKQISQYHSNTLQPTDQKAPSFVTQTPVSNENPGSGSETEKSRSSKRRRIPNKFYGYSSGDEEEKPAPSPKWRKQETPTNQPSRVPTVHPPTPRIQLTVPKQIIRKPYKLQKTIVKPQQHSSSDSTDSGSEMEIQRPHIPPVAREMPSSIPATSQKTDKDVYCYCRCPYDEVSEMIACDDENCEIEWFHFECVGILVPPRGQWFCPGCRKARGLPT